MFTYYTFNSIGVSLSSTNIAEVTGGKSSLTQKGNTHDTARRLCFVANATQVCRNDTIDGHGPVCNTNAQSTIGVNDRET